MATKIDVVTFVDGIHGFGISGVFRALMLATRAARPTSDLKPYHPQPFAEILFPTLGQGRDLQGALDGTGVGFGIMFRDVQPSDLEN